MKNKAVGNEKNILIIIASIMIVGIVALSCYMLLFKTKTVAGFDVTDSVVEDEFFIKDLIVQKIDLYDIDFDHAYSLSRTDNGARLNGVYVTQANVDDLRDFYMQVLEESESIGDNSSVSMNVKGKIDGMDVEVKNYFSEVTNVVDIVIDVDVALADYFEADVQMLFPKSLLSNIDGVSDMISGDQYGGFIMYTFDSYDQFAYVGIPKISRAYKYDNASVAFEKFKKETQDGFDETVISDDGSRLYAKTDGYLYMFAVSENKQGDEIVIINAQKMPEE